MKKPPRIRSREVQPCDVCGFSHFLLAKMEQAENRAQQKDVHARDQASDGNHQQNIFSSEIGYIAHKQDNADDGGRPRHPGQCVRRFFVLIHRS